MPFRYGVVKFFMITVIKKGVSVLLKCIHTCETEIDPGCD